jgi:hypothetical protein
MAIAYVQGKTFSNGSGSVTTVNMTLTSPVASGDTLIVTVGYVGSGAETVTITDDKSNT